MKAYKEYMDKITVSDTLHKKLVSCATNTKSVRFANIVKRYAITFTCLAVVILGVATLPRLIQKLNQWNVTLAPGINPPVSQSGLPVSQSGSSVAQPGSSTSQPGSSASQPGSSASQPGPSVSHAGPSITQSGPEVTQSDPSASQPGSPVTQSDPSVTQPGSPSTQSGQSVLHPGGDVPVSDSLNKYTLHFNKVKFIADAKLLIPGHFWQELGDKELAAIFPGLTETHSITATANFQSDKEAASLFSIDAHAVSDAGLRAYIQLAPGEVALDYKFDVEEISSDVLGTAVTAGYFETAPNSKGLKNAIYFAYFKLSGIAYYVELGGAEAEKEYLKDEIARLVGLLIDGGSADLGVLHPVMPELREDRLDLHEAGSDADFGAYLPVTLPEEFVFEDALRFINQERNELIVHWTKGLGYIDWRVSYLDDDDKARITSVADRENYDLSLYPIPRADSVPGHLREIVDNPVFSIDELTLDTVRARAYKVSDSGDEPGPRMRFSVMYGDVLVELSVKGAAPEVIFDALRQIGKQNK